MNLAAAYASAQATLARATGAPASAENVLYKGRSYCGVWGQPTVVETPMPGGGYRRRVEIVLTLTRAQFAAAPAARDQITNLLTAATYNIDFVNTDDPFHYVLTCYKSG